MDGMDPIMEDVNAFINAFAFWLSIVIFILIILFFVMVTILNIHNENKFFRAVFHILQESDSEDCPKSIRNEYEVYRNSRFGPKWKQIITLCQDLASKLKSSSNKTLYGENFRWQIVKKLENTIEVFRDEYNFEDEKVEKVIKNVSDSTNEENARTIKEYIIRLQAFCQGQVFEINQEKKEYQNKMERRKWVNRILSIFGFLGTLITIYSFFAK